MSIVAYDTLVANGAHFEWQIINGNTTLYENLISGSLSMMLYKQASIGNVMARQLDFEYFKANVNFDTTLPLQLQYRAVLNDDTSVWIDKGTYWIDKLEASPYSDKAKVTAFDALLKANATWLESGIFSATTDYAIVTGIVNDIGVTLDPDTDTLLSGSPIAIDTAPSIGANGTTSVEMLSYIGVMRGGNWIITSDNTLKLIKLFAVQNSVDIGDAVADFDASPSEEITRVCIWAGDNQYYRSPSGLTDAQWEALGGRVLDARCYIGGSQALADSLYTEFNGAIYYPYTTSKAWVDPSYELGDTITIKDVTSIISNQTMQLTALATSSLSADGQDISTSSYPYVSPINREIAQTKQSVASIQIQADSIQSTVSTIDAGITSIQTTVNQNSSSIEVLTQQLHDQNAYIRWNGATSTVEIGSSSSDTVAQINPEGFAVVENGTEILTAKNRTVETTAFKAEVITQGNYQWADEGSDGYTLFYLGS